jgi:CheY-like chemotaxis protein
MPTILVVDDEPACRHPLSRLLQIEGYEVAQAADGLEALQRLEETRCDLVLLDLLMPRMDGISFIERVRDDVRYAGLPIFLITAVHDHTTLTRARSMGIQQYLFKGDVPFMRLLELIKTQLGEPFTPVRRGRRPKNPQAQPARKITNLATDPDIDRDKTDADRDYDFMDEQPAESEFLRD